jgi:hypothetical protein
LEKFLSTSATGGFSSGIQLHAVDLIVRYYHERYFGKVLESIFGVKKNKATGKWEKLYNEKLHTLHSSTNIVRVIGSNKKRWQE